MALFRKITPLLCAAASGFLLWTCGTNLWPSGSENRELSAEGCVSLGREYERDGNYAKALTYYTKATQLDSFLTDGWYLKAKMHLRIAGIRLPTLAGELLNDNKEKVPFFPDAYTDTTPRCCKDYDGNRISPADTATAGRPVVTYNCLDSLYDTLVFLFKPSVDAYNSLLKIFNGPAFKGTFTRDKILSDFTMLTVLQTAILSLDNAPKDSQLTPGYSPLNRERRLYKAMGDNLKNVNEISIDIGEVRALFNGPDDINVMVNDLIGAAGISLASINEWDAEIRACTAEDRDTNLLKESQEKMREIINRASYYYYNDRKDNDGDYFDANGNDSVERMIWVDANGNNKIDWVNAAGDTTFCITDTLERMKEYRYRSRMDPLDTYDTAYFGWWQAGGDMHFYFKGPNGGEFVAGDWGVDEEPLDDVNNDGDSCRDEDSRVGSDTLDQDGDFVDVDTLPLDSMHNSGRSVPGQPGKTCSRMFWNDTINTDGRISDPAGNPITRDSLLDPAFLARVTRAINSGAGYGEWIAGDWGVDEEYADGLDNDGDGRTDEDGDIHLIHRPDFYTPAQRADYLNYLKTHISLDNIRGSK